MYNLLNQVGNLTTPLESIKNFSYDLIVNQSITTSSVLFMTLLATLPVVDWAERRPSSLVGKVTYSTAFVAGSVSGHVLGIGNSIRIYRWSSEPFSKIGAFLSRNFSPEINNKISEYAFGTTVALALPVIGYGMINKKKWTIFPACALAVFLQYKFAGFLVSK